MKLETLAVWLLLAATIFNYFYETRWAEPVMAGLCMIVFINLFKAFIKWGQNYEDKQ